MTLIRVRSIDSQTMRMLQVALLVWGIVWIGLAAGVAYELWVLRDLGDTVGKTGTAVDTAGKALQSLGGIPFVGGQVRGLGDQVRAAAQSAVASGAATRTTTANLAVLIGLAIALIPTAPVLAIYLPLRVNWRREQRAIARALRDRPGDPLLEEYLARRAVSNLPYAALRAVTERPWADIEQGHFADLAAAELRRLGLERTDAA